MKNIIVASVLALTAISTVSFNSGTNNINVSLSEAEAAYCYSGSKRMRQTKTATRTAQYEAAGWDCFDAPEVVVTNKQ